MLLISQPVVAFAVTEKPERMFNTAVLSFFCSAAYAGGTICHRACSVLQQILASPQGLPCTMHVGTVRRETVKGLREQAGVRPAL
jgi:hypothetical protein